MPNENIFAKKADVYSSGRQSYAPQAVEKIFSEMIKTGEKAADIGSGTGILSREFINRGYEVYCVEPNDEMRTIAEKALSKNPNFHSVSASAEHTQLPDASVSLITVASAFHWFDTELFRRECRRILTSDGTVAILASKRAIDAFSQAQHELCSRFCRGYKSLTHGIDKVMSQVGTFFGGEYSIEAFDNPILCTKSNFINRTLSSSFAPTRDDRNYKPFIHELSRLLDDFYPNDEVSVANQTILIWGKLS